MYRRIVPGADRQTVEAALRQPDLPTLSAVFDRGEQVAGGALRAGWQVARPGQAGRDPDARPDPRADRGVPGGRAGRSGHAEGSRVRLRDPQERRQRPPADRLPRADERPERGGRSADPGDGGRRPGGVKSLSDELSAWACPGRLSDRSPAREGGPMNVLALPAPPKLIVYPESDGQPMSDNSKQFRWIFVLYGNLAALFHHVDDILVGGNMNWYPVEGEPGTCVAPDVFVVFGRPKGEI